MASNQEVDFSNYFKNQPKNSKASTSKAPTGKGNSKRMVFLIILLLILAGIEAYLLLSAPRNTDPYANPPAGMQWSNPKDGPPRLIPIRK